MKRRNGWEWAVTYVKQRKGWRMSCDVGLETEPAHSPTLLSLHLYHSLFSNPSVALAPQQLIPQPFHNFTYVTVHSPTLPLLNYVTVHSPTLLSLLLRHVLWSFSNHSVTSLRHNSFSNLSVTSPTSQLILQPSRRFTYVTPHSPTLPSVYLRHSSFSNPSFASLMSQALHLRHLASRPCL